MEKIDLNLLLRAIENSDRFQDVFAVIGNIPENNDDYLFLTCWRSIYDDNMAFAKIDERGILSTVFGDKTNVLKVMNDEGQDDYYDVLNDRVEPGYESYETLVIIIYNVICDNVRDEHDWLDDIASALCMSIM